MANLGTFTISTDGYETLASATGLTLTEGTKYTIQIINDAHLREGSTGKGVLIDNTTPITYTATSDDLYINTDNSYGCCLVNIAS